MYSANWDTHSLVQRAHIDYVRQRNRILNFANQDIALYKQGGGLYVYNYAASSTNEEKGLNGISFTPNDKNTQAIAVRHGANEIALLSTDRGAFTLPVAYSSYKAQVGYFDENNQWVAERNLTIRNRKVQMPRNTCVLLTQTPGVLTGIESVSHQQTTRKAIKYFTLSGQEAATPSKGIYIVKYNDGSSRKVVLK